VNYDVCWFLYFQSDTLDHYPAWWVGDYSVVYITEILAHWTVCYMYMRVEVETRILFSRQMKSEAIKEIFSNRKRMLKWLTYIVIVLSLVCGVAVFWYYFDPNPTPIAYWVQQLLPIIMEWSFLI
jgi:hypothetical protein